MGSALRTRGWLEYGNNRRQHPRERGRGEYADRADHQAGVGRKQLTRPGDTGHQQAAGREVGSVERDSRRVAVWVTGDLTENPVSAAGGGQADRRPNLRVQQVREGEWDK